MQGQDFVVGLPRQEVRNRSEQLRSDGTSEGAADQIKDEAAHQILQSDHLVISAEAEIAKPALGLERRALLGGQADGHDCTGVWGAAFAIGLFWFTQASNVSGSSTITVERMPPWYGPQSSAQTIG